MQVDTRSFEEITSTPMTELEELESIYCEMHKDAYGVKARWYRAASVEQARKDIESLSQALDQVMAHEKDALAARVPAPHVFAIVPAGSENK